MACQETVYQWAEELQQHFPQLSRPQLRVLALWSVGMVLARSCALTAVSGLLAAALGQPANTVRQRLREGCYAASAKRGRQRQAVVVSQCFVPLLRWVLSRWDGTQVALALDATTLGQRFTVLCVSVVYRGCAIPVAWTVLPATAPHAWRGDWLRLVRQLRPAIPRPYTVIVLADRGLWAPWLFRRLVRLGWQPLLRVHQRGQFRPAGWHRFVPFTHLVPVPGSSFQGRGVAFKTQGHHLSCTLLACWEAPHAERWLLLTALAPETSSPHWYGLRAWIEAGFKALKRGGFGWQRTRMTDPDRAARLWLAVAIATLWLLSVGGDAEQAVPGPPLLALPEASRRTRRATRLRLVACFRLGWQLILAACLNQTRLPLGRFWPEPWPAPAPLLLPARALSCQNTYP
ncbi:MAG TPA: transposase [Dehalococcoidia bacterium]|nr:transposase [Dehalococcoidia bacterium]